MVGGGKGCVHPSPARSCATTRLERSGARATHATDALEDAVESCIFQKRIEVRDVRQKPKQRAHMMQNGYYRPRNLQSVPLPEILEQRVMRRTSGRTFDGEGHE